MKIAIERWIELLNYAILVGLGRSSTTVVLASQRAKSKILNTSFVQQSRTKMDWTFCGGVEAGVLYS